MALSDRLDLRLFEIDVLADHRVVLLEHQLVRRALAVLRRRVEVAGVRGRHEPDELASCFCLLAHGVTPGEGLMARRTACWQAGRPSVSPLRPHRGWSPSSRCPARWTAEPTPPRPVS